MDLIDIVLGGKRGGGTQFVEITFADSLESGKVLTADECAVMEQFATARMPITVAFVESGGVTYTTNLSYQATGDGTIAFSSMQFDFTTGNKVLAAIIKQDGAWLAAVQKMP